jgi:hypothetical protein
VTTQLNRSSYAHGLAVQSDLNTVVVGLESHNVTVGHLLSRNHARKLRIPATWMVLVGLVLCALPGNASANGLLSRLFGRNQNQRCHPQGYIQYYYNYPQQQYCWELRYYYASDRCGRAVLTWGWFLVPCAPAQTSAEEPNPPKVDVDSIKNIKIDSVEAILAKKFPWLKQGGAPTKVNATGATPPSGAGANPEANATPARSQEAMAAREVTRRSNESVTRMQSLQAEVL